MKYRSILSTTLLVAGLAAGLAAPGCKRTQALFALDPLDAASVSCNIHGPLNRTCEQCNLGDAAACVTMAQNYERRHDVTRDDRDSLRIGQFYGRACEHGYAPACVLIGEFYATLRGWDYYLRRIYADLRDVNCSAVAKACGAKDGLACRTEGMCFAEPWALRKTPVDLARAQRAYASSCELGDSTGCQRLGALLAGQGEASLADAVAAYQKACDAGLVEGCLGVAAHKYHGLGTPAAPEEADALASQGCDLGSVRACQSEQGHFFSTLWPLLADASYQKHWPTPDAATLNKLELRPRWTNTLPQMTTVTGRTGFCLTPEGGVTDVVTLDTTGDPLLDDALRANVGKWKFPKRPTTAAQLCLSHEDRLVLTYRPNILRPFYIVWDTWSAPGRSLVTMDLDPIRPRLGL